MMNEELMNIIDSLIDKIENLQKEFDESDSLTEKIKILQIINMQTKEMIRYYKVSRRK